MNDGNWGAIKRAWDEGKAVGGKPPTAVPVPGERETLDAMEAGKISTNEPQRKKREEKKEASWSRNPVGGHPVDHHSTQLYLTKM